MAKDNMEVWENRNQSEIWVQKEDSKGNLQPVKVLPGKRIEISSQERQRNQESVMKPEFDWFKNGALSHVRLIDTAEDYEEIAANPNARSEKEIVALLDLHANELKKELANIDSPLVLQRLKELVDSDKADNVTVAKVKAVKERYDELHPSKTGKQFEDYEEAIKHKIKI